MEDSVALFQAFFLVMLSGTAAWYDATTGRIPNFLTYPGIAIGIGLAAAVSFSMVGWHLLGVAAAFGFLIFFWVWGMLGGGDVKLAMMVGAFQGTWFLVHFLYYVFVFALVTVVFLSVKRIGVWRTIRFVFQNIWSLLLLRGFPETPVEVKGVQIPFAVLASLSVAVCLVLKWQGQLELTAG